MWNFLGLQCLVEEFFGIVNVYQCFFISNTLFDEVDRELGHEKKKVKLLDRIYIVFKKISYRWLKLMTCNYSCRE